MKQKKMLIVVAILCLGLMLSVLPSKGAYAKPEVIKLEFANYFPPPARHSKLSEEFIAELEKRTGGRVKTQYFAGGSLLKAPAMYKGVVSGKKEKGSSLCLNRSFDTHLADFFSG